MRISALVSSDGAVVVSAEDLVEAETLSVRLEAAVPDDLRDEAP